MREAVAQTLELAGAATVVAGVYLLLGLAPALILAGVLVFAAGQAVSK